MISAAPLIKNDPRLRSLVERLKKGMSLQAESKAMGYGDPVQFRNALRDMIGMEAYAELMSGRAKMFNKNIPVASR
jgi:methylphosphotriester-DNA--protein-cysteine methyltransferase